MEQNKPSCVVTMNFIGQFANYNDMRCMAERKKGNVASVGPKQRTYCCDGQRWRLIQKPGMKKIMFNDKFCLTRAVLDRQKTMTRRAISDKLLTDAMVYSCGDIEKRNQYLLAHAPYKVGDVVAIAQSYKSLTEEHPNDDYANYYLNQYRYTPGWDNKMFVKSDLMTRRIRITGVKVEHIQDISEEDCRREGFVRVEWREYPESGSDRYIDHTVWTLPMYNNYGHLDDDTPGCWSAWNAYTAFGALIIQMMGRKVWEGNPLVFAYGFELEI